jgi:hypothetical protein
VQFKSSLRHFATLKSNHFLIKRPYRKIINPEFSKGLIMKRYLFSLCILSAIACGGGSSGSSGMLIEGTLTEGRGTTHSRSIKHGAGEFLEEVTVCATGNCSRTDGRGQWGFMVSEEVKGTDIIFSFQGHGIDSATMVRIPNEANDIFMHFEHNDPDVRLHHMEVNGVRVPNHGSHDHSHHQ